jgi:large subunit ribosomal protein L9
MDVVLVQAVDKLGEPGSVVKVKTGYARNFLLPRGLAVAATPAELQRAEALKRRREAQQRQQQAAAEALKQRLEAVRLKLALTVGEDAQVFGSITAHDLAEALQRAGVAVEKHLIQLEQPLKALGVYEVPVRLHPHVTALLNLSVVKA